LTVRWTADRMDSWHARPRGLRVALSRQHRVHRGGAPVTSADRHEVLIGRLPMTGET
jgi:hypothetical protein